MEKRISVNPLAVVVATLALQVFGVSWYALMQAPWVAGLARPMSDFENAGTLPYVISIFAAAIVSAGLAWLSQRLALRGALGGLKLALGLAVVFVLPMLTLHFFFALIAPVVTLIDGAHTLIAMLIAGGIVGFWNK